MSYSPYFFNKNASGTVSGSRGTITNFQNGSGSTLAKATLVAVNASSQLVPVSVVSEATVLTIVGMTSMSIPNAAIGAVTTTAPTDPNMAVVRVGMAIDANTIEVQIQVMGVN